MINLVIMVYLFLCFKNIFKNFKFFYFFLCFKLIFLFFSEYHFDLLLLKIIFKNKKKLF
jgi:hypothetical protein